MLYGEYQYKVQHTERENPMAEEDEEKQIPDLSSQSYDPSSYYNQQQNPNFPKGNYQSAPSTGPPLGTVDKMTWLEEKGLGKFIGPVAQPATVDGGSRGGRPHRGRGAGNFRGRGRGRGRASFSPMTQNGQSLSSNPNPSSTGVAESAANNQREQKEKPVGPIKPPGQFHCELCRIDCTALDLLNQHKIGKRHKKNLEKAGIVEPLAVISESVAETVGLDNTSSDKPVEAVNQSGDQKRGTKRKMRGGRSGKSVKKANEQLAKVVIPIICELCFVKCDTQEVYERHVAGKKHISKLKRYEGHHNMYGPAGISALYPPMATPLVNAQEPQQAYSGPQGSVTQPDPYLPHYYQQQAHYAAQPTATGANAGFQQIPGYTMPGPTS